MPKRDQYFLTPIKRSHLVLNSGVGALVRTRSKITALVCDLIQWEQAIPTPRAIGVDRDAARREVLLRNSFRDPVIESSIGVDFLVSPPVADGEGRSRTEWRLPLVRFPLAEVCTNKRCNSLSHSSPGDALRSIGRRGCDRCVSPTRGRSKWAKAQVPIMLVCPAGHLDEVDYSGLVHPAGSACEESDIRVVSGDNVKWPKVRCMTCDRSYSPVGPLERPCTGRRPWVVGIATGNDDCAEKMRVVERTSVSLYYAVTRSALFIPEVDISDSLVRWIQRFVDLQMLVEGQKDQQLSVYHERATKAGHSAVDFESFKRHVAAAFPEASDDGSPNWDDSEVRSREFDRLTDMSKSGAGTELLEYREVSDFGGSPYLGPEKPIHRVIAIDRLAETRMLLGFTRWDPKARVPDEFEGIRQLRGIPFETEQDRWLPAYRVTGEGILFVFSAERLQRWWSEHAQFGETETLFRDKGKKKSGVSGRIAHTFAHAVLRVLADRCGYPLPGIRDRIYDLDEERIGVLVYTAEGDSLGTLGGLVEHADGERVARLVRDALENCLWCAQDPVCNSSLTTGETRMEGACHHCMLLPETSCEAFNADLDRGLLIGSAQRGISAFFA